MDLDQPQGRLARALLEPDPEVPTSFKARELEKYARNQRRGDAEGENYDFYDVTAWSLPYTMGLDAWWTEDLVPVTGDELALAEGDPVRALAPAGGVSARAASAYVFRNDRQAAARLAKLTSDLAQARDLARDPDPQLAELARADLERLTPEVAAAEARLNARRLPREPPEDRATTS